MYAFSRSRSFSIRDPRKPGAGPAASNSPSMAVISSIRDVVNEMVWMNAMPCLPSCRGDVLATVRQGSWSVKRTVGLGDCPVLSAGLAGFQLNEVVDHR